MLIHNDVISGRQLRQVNYKIRRVGHQLHIHPDDADEVCL